MCMMGRLHMSRGKILVSQTTINLMKIEATGFCLIALLLLGMWSQLRKGSPV